MHSFSPFRYYPTHILTMAPKISAILFLFASITLFANAQQNDGVVNSAQIGPRMDTLLMCIIQKVK